MTILASITVLNCSRIHRAGHRCFAPRSLSKTSGFGRQRSKRRVGMGSSAGIQGSARFAIMFTRGCVRPKAATKRWGQASTYQSPGWPAQKEEPVLRPMHIFRVRLCLRKPKPLTTPGFGGPKLTCCSTPSSTSCWLIPDCSECCPLVYIAAASSSPLYPLGQLLVGLHREIL